MDANDFRRIALSFEGAEEGSHMGQADFRVGGKIFATLASQALGYGNLKLTLQQQADFVEELPEVFLPIPGRLGTNGNDAYPPGGRQPRPAGRCIAHGMEAARREQCQIKQQIPKQAGKEGSRRSWEAF